MYWSNPREHVQFGNAELGEIPAPAHPIAIPIRENASVAKKPPYWPRQFCKAFISQQGFLKRPIYVCAGRLDATPVH